ncbi:glycosyltransferase family protein [Sporichthya polymorpha]|uniref:glycosyltransferase family protein n=1 Tax=Sporichthya polymorpha TaxID=35751 RepID=UPI0012EBF5F9|nr:glycosyltransferase [Sporichthya polymorpha]
MAEILVLGTADWHQPIATNQHYAVRELSRSRPVTYIESMGLRQPELSLRDLRRVAKRLSPRQSAVSVRRPCPPNVRVVTPLVLPRHTGLARRINRPRVHALAQSWFESAEPRLLWTYTPVTYGLEEHATATVYHCVDLLGEVEGIPRDLIWREEERMAALGVHAFGTSEHVVAHLRDRGFIRVGYWPNVADTEVIAAARPSQSNRVPRRAVFAGNLSPQKIDFDLLLGLVGAGFDVHLAGPVAEGGGSARSALSELRDAGATYHGLLEPLQLAKLYWTAEVGLIPYLDNPYTRGVNPLKTFEYLAAGLAVVSTPLPSVTPISNHVVMAAGRDAFIRAVEELAHPADPEPRLKIAQAHSWTQRGDEIRATADRLLRGLHHAEL